MGTVPRRRTARVGRCLRGGIREPHPVQPRILPEVRNLAARRPDRRLKGGGAARRRKRWRDGQRRGLPPAAYLGSRASMPFRYPRETRCPPHAKPSCRRCTPCSRRNPPRCSAARPSPSACRPPASSSCATATRASPSVTLSPLRYHYQHRAEVEAVVQTGAGRDTAFDALAAAVGTALAADRTLGGLCDWAGQSRASPALRVTGRQIIAQSVKRQVTGGFGRGSRGGAGLGVRLRFISGAPISRPALGRPAHVSPWPPPVSGRSQRVSIVRTQASAPKFQQPQAMRLSLQTDPARTSRTPQVRSDPLQPCCRSWRRPKRSGAADAVSGHTVHPDRIRRHRDADRRAA